MLNQMIGLFGVDCSLAVIGGVSNRSGLLHIKYNNSLIYPKWRKNYWC